MKKNMHNPTMMIKSKFSNQVHKLLEPNIEIKGSNRWKYPNGYKLTDKQKIEMFDMIVILHKNASEELTNYQYNRRQKRRVMKDRIARGWKPKEKTKKEDLVVN